MQDQEVGDGTTSVVIVAAELLRRANQLVKNKIHPTSIIAGFRRAMKLGVAYIKSNMTVKADTLGRQNLLNAAKTSMSSKIIGNEEDFFAEMVVNAVTSVKYTKSNGKIVYPVRSINILKAHGRSALESKLIDGYALNGTRAAQGMPRSVQNAKIAFLDFNITKHRMQMGVEILLNNPGEAEKMLMEREKDITKERIQKLLAAGANVFLTTKGCDDMALKYFVEAKAIAIRRVNIQDLKRLAKATGGKILKSLSDMEGEETIDPACLGTAREVVEEKVGDGELTYIKGCV